jgi:hypothetical protein
MATVSALPVTRPRDTAITEAAKIALAKGISPDLARSQAGADPLLRDLAAAMETLAGAP